MLMDSDPAMPETSRGASEIPEHMCILLLEGAQECLVQVQAAIHCGDAVVRDHYLRRTLAILVDLNDRLNDRVPSGLVRNLSCVYGWWGHEITDAGMADDANRVQQVHAQMGEIRQAWEQVLFKGMGLTGNPEF